MLNIGFSELLLFGIIALIVLGPDKLPTAVRTAGRWYARLRFMLGNLQQDIEKELQLSELREHMQQELDRIKLIEAQMQVQLNQMSGEIAELNHAELNHAENNHAENNHAESNHAESNHTAPDAVSSQDSATPVLMQSDTNTASSMNAQTMNAIYFPFKSQRSSVTKAPYTAPYWLNKDSWSQATINAYPQPSVRLHVETA